MSKVDILRLDSVTSNDTTATETINTNFNNIKIVIDTLLSRNGDTPNYMTAVLDMNSNRIINTAQPVDDLDVINKAYLDNFIVGIQEKVNQAETAADAAAERAMNAATSATNSAVSAQAARDSAKQSEENAAAAAADASMSESYSKDAEEYKDAAKGFSEDAKDYAERAEAAAAEIEATDFAVDLSYTNNTLQLIDQNGDALGTSITLKTLPSQLGQSGKFLTTNGILASWATVDVQGDYKGDWSASETYNKGDIVYSVLHPGFYMCLQDNTDGTHVPGNHILYWSEISNDGTVKFTEKSDNVDYPIALTAANISGSGYAGPINYSANAPKINASTGDIIGYQKTSNLVTSVSSLSTDTQYPSAKLFYDTCGDIESLINAL